jgi:septal ring factor EnvC (AmiA/AmiB activator)
MRRPPGSDLAIGDHHVRGNERFRSVPFSWREDGWALLIGTRGNDEYCYMHDVLASEGGWPAVSSEPSREAALKIEREAETVALRERISELERRLNVVDSENSVLRTELGKLETTRSKLLMQVHRLQENMKILESHRAELTSELYQTKNELAKTFGRKVKRLPSLVKTYLQSTKNGNPSKDDATKPQ